jgi:hypothetical protein
MPLTIDQIDDLILTTHKHRDPQKFNQIAQSKVSYPLLDYMLRKKNMKSITGTSVIRPVMLKKTGASRMVGMFATDTVNVADVAKNVEAPWRHINTPIAYDVKEFMANSGKEQIIQLLKLRKADAELSRVEHISNQLWSSPADSSDALNIWGIPYWVVGNATAGFNGGAPSGFTTVGGLNPSSVDVPNWKNYTAQYAAVSKADLIKKMVDGFAETGFESPITVDDFARGEKTDRFRIFAKRSVISDLEALLEQQNDQLGSDVAPMFGKASINRTPITRDPALDDAVAFPKSPVYALDMRYWELFYLAGSLERTSKPEAAPNQHDVRVIHIDDTMNLICTDRRRQAVFQTA